MDYKREMKKMKKKREEYFPVFEYLLGIYSSRGGYEFPVKLEELRCIALVLELIDIGYLDSDSFIVKKSRGEINALYYTGGYPLSEQGMIAHRTHLHSLRGRYIKSAAVLSLILFIVILYFMILN